jgi:flagellar biosynthesis/type III secretory pathway M-ring protein FliF/YscJ
MASSTPTSLSASSGSNVGAIAGGTVGGIAAVVVILGIILLLRRRRQNNAPQSVQMSQPVEAPDSSRPAALYQGSKASQNPVIELQG